MNVMLVQCHVDQYTSTACVSSVACVLIRSISCVSVKNPGDS